jgi:hypothetical protein
VMRCGDDSKDRRRPLTNGPRFRPPTPGSVRYKGWLARRFCGSVAIWILLNRQAAEAIPATAGSNRFCRYWVLANWAAVASFLAEQASAVRPAGRAQPRGSSISNLASLPLHGEAGGMADLDPDAARSGPVGAVHLLGNDALSASWHARANTVGPSQRRVR